MVNHAANTPTLFDKQDKPSIAIPQTPHSSKHWWAPLWRGLVVDPTAKHQWAMRSALWIYLYLLVHADRRTGVLKRKLRTIADDMGIKRSVVQYGMSKLRRGGYLATRNSGRSLEITIAKWKPLSQGTRRK